MGVLGYSWSKVMLAPSSVTTRRAQRQRHIEIEADAALLALTATMEDLAWHRGTVERSLQPGLEFGEG